MNRTLRTLAAAVVALMIAPLAAADFEDGNYVASFTIDSSTGDRTEEHIPDHPWNQNPPSMMMRTFIDRFTSRTDGRLGWYSTADAEDWQTQCDNVPTLSYFYWWSDLLGYVPPNFFGGNDYDEEDYLILGLYFEYYRMIPLDGLGPSTTGKYVEDPTNCLYFDRTATAGFGQGDEPHPCASSEISCRIGAEEDTEIDGGIGFGPSAWMYPKGPFRLFQLAEHQKLAVLQCDLIIEDPTNGNIIRSGQIAGVTQDAQDGPFGEVFGDSLIYQPSAGAGPCEVLINQDSDWINLVVGGSAGPGACNWGSASCVMGTEGAIIMSEKASAWLPKSGEGRPFASTIGVMCANMAGYYFDAGATTPGGKEPWGWLVAHLSDYDWVTFYEATDTTYIEWGLDPAHMSNVSDTSQGCAHFTASE